MDKHADLIMVSYNNRRFLPEFFHFVKSKTAYPFHLIVIDNNSTDGSRAYLIKMKQTNSIGRRMKLVLNPKKLRRAQSLEPRDRSLPREIFGLPEPRS